ncbi:MAG: MFS transporter, partial [Rhodococcus sp. (in: high G+C Gram-positive bacteria)]
MTQNAVKQHRYALFTLFLVQGIALASWVTRTPAIRDAVHASTAEMGFILFGLSVGSMTSVLSAGFFVARFGTKPVAITGTWGIVLSMPLIGSGTALHVAPLVAIGL